MEIFNERRRLHAPGEYEIDAVNSSENTSGIVQGGAFCAHLIAVFIHPFKIRGEDLS